MRFPHALVAALVAPLPVSYGMPASWRLAWTALVLAVVVLVLVLGLVRSVPSGGAWLVAAFGALTSGIASASNATDLGAHWQAAVLLVLFWGAGPPVLYRVAEAAPHLARTAAAVFVAVQTLSAAIGILQSFTGLAVVWGQSEFGRSPGLAGHTNILGLLSAVAVFLCLGARRKAALLLAAVNLLGVFVSGSMSSMSALVFGAVAYALVQRVALVKVLAFVAILAASFFALDAISQRWAAFRSPLHRVLQTTGQTGEISTVELRIETVKYALGRIANDWFFGAGLNDESGRTFDSITLTHNMPVRAWFQGGILLFIAVTVVFGVLLRLVWRAFERRAGAPEAGILVTLVAFSFTSATLSQPYYWLVCTAAWASLAARTEAAPPPTSPLTAAYSAPRVATISA
jgi:hypothetical protein